MPLLLGSDFHSWLIAVTRLSLWLTTLVVIFVPLERLFAAHPQKIFRKGIGADLAYYFLNGLFTALLLSVPISVLAWAVHRAIPDSFLAATAALPIWARAIIGLVAGEIGYYWGHRLTHEIPFLWRFHSIHHSAEHVDFMVNTRAHPIDMVFSRFCGLVPLYVLGLGGPLGPENSVVPVLVTVIGTTWGYFIHANVRWRFGPLEWLVSTPAFHHWHHTRTGPINRNYASTLPWLDRLFGTHYLPNEWPAAYGVKAKLPETLVGQLVYPLSTEPDPPAVQDVLVPEIPPPVAATSEVSAGVSCLNEQPVMSAKIETPALEESTARYEHDTPVIGQSVSEFALANGNTAGVGGPTA